MRLGIPLTHIEYEYSQKMLDGVIDFVKKTDNDFFVFISKEPRASEREFSYQEWAVSKFFNKQNLDGLLLPTSALNRYASEEEIHNLVQKFSKELPTFSMSGKIDGVPSLTVDVRDVFKHFVNHIIKKHNRKHFAFMGIDCNSEDVLLRYKLFREVLKENNIDFDEKLLLFGSYTVDSAVVTMNNHFKCKEDITFDALICVTDEMALGVIDYLSQLGINVPKDVIVTGFDNTIHSLYCIPSLTTVDQRVSYQVSYSAALLEKMVNGECVPEHTEIRPSCCFRASCGCLDRYETRYTAIDENEKFIFCEEKFFNKIYSSLFDKRDLNLKFLEFIEELQSNLSLERLALRTEWYLRNFDIKQCAICLYPAPVPVLPNEEYNLPTKARLFYFKNESKNKTIVDDKNYFNCTEKLLPDDMIDELKGIQIVKMIYHGEYQYGYMIMYSSFFDGADYQLLFSLFSKFISSAYTVTMSEKKQSNLEQTNLNLSILSKTDELTGILNRRGFLFTAQQQLNIAASLNQTGLVIYGDIDGLKYINDTFGHDAGDRAILAEVELLTKTFRNADIIGRLGGDEFAILSISLSLDVFKKLKQRLEEFCKEWNENSNEPFNISISLGAVEFEKANYNLLELLKKADTEQYKEKRSKKEKKNNPNS